VLVAAAVGLHVYVNVWHGSLGLIGAIGATIVPWRRRVEDQEVTRLSRQGDPF
jgi:hypothetical protein